MVVDINIVIRGGIETANLPVEERNSRRSASADSHSGFIGLLRCSGIRTAEAELSSDTVEK
jgi:hypothetical protein